ncbi:MlaD family protein [Sandaracinus amylolyticus]|uniref:MlaD family protein n=1 Tax=Sandaracinus amylolyticus TaxID=927083 RepID=UPI001F30D6E0|nr:MlaD family protein [Sandaracinus amylolyticus]UJR81007.1 ABC organic solvent transporter solute-binding substrate-binding protein [Sandaracinus amylolyticus]
MRDQLKAARVGALVVAALVAAFLVYRAVDESSSRGGGYRVYALFNDAQGLITKSRVTIAGITVGRIERITLQGAQARVDMVIDDDVELYEDASVRRVSASLLGEYLLAIHPGTPTQPRLHDGDRIMVVEETPGMGDIMTDVGAIASSVRAVSAQLERSFGTDEAGQQMASALRNLSEALEAVNRTIRANEESVGATLQNIEAITADARPLLEEILRDIQRVTEDIREVVEANQADIDQGVGEVDDTIASIHRASEQLELVLADVGEITERTAAGEGTLGRLTTDEHLIDEVETTVEGVSDVLGSFVRLRTIMELRSEYNFLANTFKNYFSIRILPREGRYFLVQLIDDPRGRTTVTTTQVRRSPPPEGEPEFYEETRITTSEQLVFTLMLAQRVYFATFRFGILESSGGLGVDLNFFDERLEINADIFQFGYSQFPRVRVRASFELVSSLYILGGVDDFLNERTVDIFLGAMLRFDDEDLANLFPFFGGAVGGLGN